MKSLIVDSFAFTFATIVVLVVVALYLGMPAGMLSMICSPIVRVGLRDAPQS